MPDPVANEMAADLAADLAEAEAEGASAEQVLGSGAFDPHAFAASWAAAAAVIVTVLLALAVLSSRSGVRGSCCWPASSRSSPWPHCGGRDGPTTAPRLRSTKAWAAPAPSDAGGGSARPPAARCRFRARNPGPMLHNLASGTPG